MTLSSHCMGKSYISFKKQSVKKTIFFFSSCLKIWNIYRFLHLQTVTYFQTKRLNKTTKKHGVFFLLQSKSDPDWSPSERLTCAWAGTEKKRTSFCQTFHFLGLCQAVWIALMSLLQMLSSYVKYLFPFTCIPVCIYFYVRERDVRANKNQKRVGECFRQPGR